MNGRERRERRLLCALLSAVLAAAAASPALGVGVLQSLDLQIIQGSTSLYSGHFNTVGNPMNGSLPLYGGNAINGTNVWANIIIDQPTVPNVVDRNFHIYINGKNASGGVATLFRPADEGAIQIKLTNMVYTRPDPMLRPEPWHPDDFDIPGLNGLPFFYMLHYPEGFLDLPLATQFTPPNYAPSIQVRHSVWTDYYGFAKLNSGLATGFGLSNIPDVSGTGPSHTGAPNLIPISANPPPYFLSPVLQPRGDWGFVDEIGITLMMRDVAVPEPATLGMIALAPLMLRARRRRA